MTKKKSTSKTKEQPVANEYREQLLENLKNALACQKATLDEDTGRSVYDREVNKAIVDLMIENSKESLANSVRIRHEQAVESFQAYQKIKEEAAREAEKAKERLTPVESHLVNLDVKTWLSAMDEKARAADIAKLSKWNTLYERLLVETKDRLLEEATNPKTTDAEYDDVANAENAKSNVISLPSNKKTNAEDLGITETVYTEEKIGLWKRFKQWLISKLQD